ncbi:MAG TPA: hypothetical protein VLM11_19165 [Streptosporangiaceae bacterium]|nr:hypothetical protein [Streptosporangiaceae bacterium]
MADAQNRSHLSDRPDAATEVVSFWRLPVFGHKLQWLATISALR